MANPARTWIELSRSALRHNVDVLSRSARPARVMAIVKSNAYGHGGREIVSMLPKSRLWGLGVAYGEEALQLRQQGYKGRIMALSAWEKADLPQLRAKRVDVGVYDFTTLEQVIRLHRQGKAVVVHLKLDTGTSRIGFRPEDMPELSNVLRKSSLPIRGVYTHFAHAEDASSVKNRRQWRMFQVMRRLLPPTTDTHAACTAAIVRYPETRGTIVRPGIGLYGIWPSAETETWAKSHVPSSRLRPVLSWYTRVMSVKRVPAGTSVGYGATYTYRRAGRLAIIPVGYGDGLPRALSNRGAVSIRGREYPIIGRVCMNLTMIDVTSNPRIVPGDQVELIGPHVPVERHAAWTDTIAYEILTDLSPTIHRHIVT